MEGVSIYADTSSEGMQDESGDDDGGFMKPWGIASDARDHPFEMGKRDFLKISRILNEMPRARKLLYR